MNIGIIGCGKISGVYTQTMQAFDFLNVVACADIHSDIANTHCINWGIDSFCTVDELLLDNSIDMVVILTPPVSHSHLIGQALEHGKHVYCEKPLALTRDEAKKNVLLAKEKKLFLGCAPDTVLGAGLQTARAALDDGCIGRPVSASAHMLTAGPESWHPNPFFLYAVGGGPLFDMGPYYLTAMIHLLGPATHVAAMGAAGGEDRFVGSGQWAGEKIPVHVHTHLNGILAFASDVLLSMTLSFDAPGQTTAPHIEIHGTKGTLVLSDPNTFGETVLLRKAEDEGFTKLPLHHGYTENCRGVGVAELATAIFHQRTSRMDASVALHVIDIMQSLNQSAENQRFVNLQTSCMRPEPFICTSLYSIDDFSAE